ncbi:GON-4-like protein [Elysia marginata]|uniref:GON-4-like protein n=1 Tax=Elysia marginata TaxID=1093978 RepID=A0AAV4IDK4_9GAST|nr:GON-4-like protein [Elysia marginata]
MSECQSLPDIGKPSEDDFIPSSSMLPATSTPQLARVAPIFSKTSEFLSKSPSVSCEDEASAQLSGIPSAAPPLLSELTRQKGQIIVLPGATSSSLPLKGIFYPLESVNVLSQNALENHHFSHRGETSQAAIGLVRPGSSSRSQTPIKTSSVLQKKIMSRVANVWEKSSKKNSLKPGDPESPSLDILAKTLISCGIGEDMSNLSPIPPDESFEPSPVTARYGNMDSTVRNLRKAFDETENAEAQFLDNDSAKRKISNGNCHGNQEIKKGTNIFTHSRSNPPSGHGGNGKQSISLPMEMPQNPSKEKMKIRLSSSRCISVLSLKNLDSLPLDKSRIHFSSAQKAVSDMKSSSPPHNVHSVSWPAGNSSARTDHDKSPGENQNLSNENVEENLTLSSTSATAEADKQKWKFNDAVFNVKPAGNYSALTDHDNKNVEEKSISSSTSSTAEASSDCHVEKSSREQQLNVTGANNILSCSEMNNQACPVASNNVSTSMLKVDQEVPREDCYDKKNFTNEEEKNSAQFLLEKDFANSANGVEKTSANLTDNEENKTKDVPCEAILSPNNSSSLKEKKTSTSSDRLDHMPQSIEKLNYKDPEKDIPKEVKSPIENDTVAEEDLFETASSEDYVPSPDMISEEPEVDQEELDEIMADIVTIRFDPQERRQDKKEIAVDNRARDINNGVPENKVTEEEESHTDYVIGYFQRVKDMLKNSCQRFEMFLCLLSHLNVQHNNPFELYLDLIIMLHEHMDLVEDYAGLLLSFQAILCKCTISSCEYLELQNFLSELQSNSCASFSVRTLCKWLDLLQEDNLDRGFLREQLMVLFQTSPSLIEKCSQYFLSKPSLTCKLSCIQNKNSYHDARSKRRVKLKSTEKRSYKRTKAKHQDEDGKQNTQTLTNPECHASSEFAMSSNECKPHELADSYEGNVNVKRTRITPAGQSTIRDKEHVVDKKDNDGKALQKDKLSEHTGMKEKKTLKSKTGCAENVQPSVNKTSIIMKNSGPSTTSSSAVPPDGQQGVFEVDKRSSPSPVVSSSLNQNTPITSIISSAFQSVPAASSCSTLPHNSQQTSQVLSPKFTGLYTQSSTAVKNLQPKQNPFSSLKASSNSAYAKSTSNMINTSYSKLTPETCSGKNVSNIITTNFTTCGTETTKAPNPQLLPHNFTFRAPQPPQPVAPASLPVTTDTLQQPRRAPFVYTSPIRIPVLVYLQPKKFASSLTMNELTVEKDSSQSSTAVKKPHPNPQDVNIKPSVTKVNSVQSKSFKGSAGKVKKKSKSKSAKLSSSSVSKSNPKDNFTSNPLQMSDQKTKNAISESSTLLEKSGINCKSTTEKVANSVFSQEVTKNVAADIITFLDKNVPPTSSKVESDDIYVGENEQAKLSSNKKNFEQQSSSDNIAKPQNMHLETSNAKIIDSTHIDALVKESLSSRKYSSINIDNKAKQQNLNENNLGQNLNPDASPSKASYLSPSKLFRREMPPEVVQNYLDTMSRGPTEESLDPHFLQQIAHLLVSPSKHNTDSVSKFDLLAFIESSQFTCKDLATSTGFSRAASQFFNKTSPSSVTGPVGFSQAFKEHGLKRSQSKEHDEEETEYVSHKSSEESPKAKDKTGNSISDPDRIKDVEFYAGGQEDNKNSDGRKLSEEDKSMMDKDNVSESQMVYPPEDLSPSVWTMEWDEKILEVVVENEGVTESVIERLQLQIPMKSISELTSRANELLKMMQKDIENEELQEDRCN